MGFRKVSLILFVVLALSFLVVFPKAVFKFGSTADKCWMEDHLPTWIGHRPTAYHGADFCGDRFSGYHAACEKATFWLPASFWEATGFMKYSTASDPETCAMVHGEPFYLLWGGFSVLVLLPLSFGLGYLIKRKR